MRTRTTNGVRGRVGERHQGGAAEVAGFCHLGVPTTFQEEEGWWSLVLFFSLRIFKDWADGSRKLTGSCLGTVNQLDTRSLYYLTLNR